MANELELSYQGAATLYAVIRRQSDSKVWSATNVAFETWSDTSLSDYGLAMANQGGDLYQADWPSDMATTACRVNYYRQDGASPATDDLLLATHAVTWNGATVVYSSSTAVDSLALTSLEKIKRYMRLETTAHDDLLAELINQVSRRIESICGRRFLKHTRREWHRPGMMGYVILDQYPITSLGRLLTGKTNSLELTAASSVLRATAGVTESAVVLRTVSAAGVTTETELALTDYPTTAALATAVDALAEWSATASRDAASVELHRDSYSCEGGDTIWLCAADQPALPRQTNHEAGTIRFDAGELGPHRQPILVEYEAGYTTVPYDVELVTHEMTAEAFRHAARDTSLNSERIGSYGYSIASAVELSEGQLARLRPYMAVRCA